METNTTWVHFEGVGLDGALQGELLNRIPAIHMTWGEWRRLHPETEVILPPELETHRDCRHGHGAEERFARAGISPAFVRTVEGRLDTRLSENAMVLAVTHGNATRVYPLSEVKSAGGVVHDDLRGEPVVILAGPGADSFAMSAFSRRMNGNNLTFTVKDGVFTTAEMGDVWSIEGKAVSGPCVGHALEPLNFTFMRWHGWAWAHKTNDIYRLPSAQSINVQEGVFAQLLIALRSGSYDLDVLAEVVSLARPNESERSIQLYVNSDRFLLHKFSDQSSARDYSVVKPHSVRAGSFVLESDPEERLKFTDALHTKMLPDQMIPWSKLLDVDDRVRAGFMDLVQGSVAEAKAEGPGLVGLLDGLRRHGYEVQLGEELKIEGIRTGQWVTEITRAQLQVNAVNGYIVYVNADPFIVYKFSDADSAEAYRQKERHSVQVDRFLFRSTPSDMYYDSRNGFGQRPNDKISWSKLLTDDRFKENLWKSLSRPQEKR